MNKSAIQNQLRYIIAKEQYMKPLLENEIITEEVYNEVLENLYDEFEVWRHNRIQNPGIEFRKKKRGVRNNLLGQNPGYISLTPKQNDLDDNLSCSVFYSLKVDVLIIYGQFVHKQKKFNLIVEKNGERCYNIQHNI